MGSIYGNANQLSKAISAYKNGIKTDSTNQRIYYNLGIVQYKGKKYYDAEQNFIKAIRRDSTDAGSVRMYALTTFHQNKRVQALFGFCRFLQIEPNTERSAEAFNNLNNILNNGVLKSEAGYRVYPGNKAQIDAENFVLNSAVASVSSERYISPTAALTAKLNAAFKAFENAEATNYYFWYTLAGYYSKLSKTKYLEIFARVISQSNIAENAAWLKGNANKIAAYEAWMKENKSQ
jgi:tetratricopeptide (TPR) repeat protein